MSENEIREIIEGLKDLPFQIGSKKEDQENFTRLVHNVGIDISPYIRMDEETPESEKIHHIAITFQEKGAWGTGVNIDSSLVDNLEINQPMYDSAQNWTKEEREEIYTRIGFSLKDQLKLAGRKIGYVGILIKC